MENGNGTKKGNLGQTGAQNESQDGRQSNIAVCVSVCEREQIS